MRTEKGIHELMLGIIAEGSDMSLTVGQKIGITTRLIEALREEGNLIIPHVVFSEAEVCEHDWQTIFYLDTEIIGRYCPICKTFEQT